MNRVARRHTALFSTFVVASVLLGAIPSAQAYVVLFDPWGAPRTWNKTSVPWRINSAGSQDVPFSEALGAIQGAFDEW
ncbi:MAG: hypothetical protein ACI9OJ_003324, partial [Myxococcota bacterium]